MQSSFVRNKIAATSNPIPIKSYQSAWHAQFVTIDVYSARKYNKSNIIYLHSMDWLKAAAPWPFLSHCVRAAFFSLYIDLCTTGSDLGVFIESS